MIVMQKSTFMQELTFAVNIECLHSSLQAKLLVHNCACPKRAKTCFIAYKEFSKLSPVKNKCISCTYTRAINIDL